MLIRFRKPAIGLSKDVIGPTIKYTGHPGRRFLAALPLVFVALPLVFVALPLCVFAFKLLKLPSYAGYRTVCYPGLPAIIHVMLQIG